MRQFNFGIPNIIKTYLKNVLRKRSIGNKNEESKLIGSKSLFWGAKHKF